MRKILCVMLAMMILFTAMPAMAQTADEIDLKGMTDEQLEKGLKNAEDTLEQLTILIERIKEEQARRSGETPETAKSGEVQHTPVTIKRSPDKYTWYIQDCPDRKYYIDEAEPTV